MTCPQSCHVESARRRLSAKLTTMPISSSLFIVFIERYSQNGKQEREYWLHLRAWFAYLSMVTWEVEDRAMKIRILPLILAVVSAAGLCRAQSDWRQKVQAELPLLGHRNWIAVVDSAYPLQTSAGIETIETGADQLTVLDFVLHAINSSKHVRPIVHTDQELQFIDEHDAPGVVQYRRQLRAQLAGLDVDSMLHDELITKLNQTGASFHILLLKTTMTIPYTSVFLQLDCRYWGAASEAKLREAMKVSATH